MRLVTKTTIYFLIALVPLLTAAGFYLIKQFNKEINNRSDKELLTNEIQWIRYLQSQVENSTTVILKTTEISIFPVDAPTTIYPGLTDTYEYNENLKTRVPYRQLIHHVSIHGLPYLISIKKSQEQKAVLVANVTRIMLFVFAGLFVSTLVFNWAISRNLWKPFKNSLQKIRSAELQKMEAIHFEDTNVKEFNELNASLNYMTRKIYTDYVNMKEFTENAAHEMQTPLAVVQSKLELLLQDSNLKDDQVQSILQASSALSRLGKLNQGLLLLAKIENNQFETKEAVSITETIKKYLSLFDELIQDKQLVVETNYENDLHLPLHPFLADSLVTNLLGNAIKYNYEKGKILIVTKHQEMSISNTGAPEPLPSVNLFRRFNTSKNAGETSNGLGLAIVKKITEAIGIDIFYHADNGMHHFVLKKQGDGR
ncbi:MAG: HAMP domain-containing sensor histidine kinase [Chitinophagaceae bacterium]